MELRRAAGRPLRYRFGKDFVWLQQKPDMLATLKSVAEERQKDGRQISLAGTYDSVYYMTPSLGFAKTGKALTVSYVGSRAATR